MMRTMRRPTRALVGALLLVLLATAAPLAAPSGAGAATTGLASGTTVVVMGGLGSKATDYGNIQSFLTGKGYTVKVYGAPHEGYQWDKVNNRYVLDASGGKIPERIGPMTVDFTDWVTKNVGTTSIALVAHSAGGLIARNYVKTVDGGSRVTKVMRAGVANYGTLFASADSDYAIGSTFLASLNAGDVSVGRVGYWSLTTTVDNIVFPFENQQLPRTGGTNTITLSYPYQKHTIPGTLPDAQVTNLIVQDQCPWSLVQHIGMTSSASVQAAIDQALRGIRTITIPC